MNIATSKIALFFDFITHIYCDVFMTRGNNNSGFSGFNEESLFEQLQRLHTTDITHSFAFDSTQTRAF
jgi:hypothetical protein